MTPVAGTDNQTMPTIQDGAAVAEVLRPEGRAPLVLVCEHASPAIPAALGDLGLSAEDRLSHAAWDPGAADLARHLSEVFDAPLVLATVSRLVHDLNRPAGTPEAVPDHVERIAVPGNAGLDAAARRARADAVYRPFHARVAGLLDARGQGTALVTVHSFNPTWFGQPRTTEIGILNDADPAFADAMLAAAPEEPAVAANEPYSAADGVTHMLAAHAGPRGLPSAMIEVRADLLADDDGVRRIGWTLAQMLTAALAGRRDAAAARDERQRA